MTMPPAWIKELGLFMTASAVVISNDAPAVVKAVARVAKVALGNRIQICDGVDDQVEIEAAINTIPSPGGRVRLSAGMFNISAPVTIHDGLTLEGQGLTATGILAGGVALSNAIVIVGGDVAIKNMSIVINPGAGAPGSRPNCIYSNDQACLLLEHLYLVGDNTVADDGSDVRQCGVCFERGSSSWVISCYITMNVRHGISINTNSEFITITDNICEGNLGVGISLSDSSRSTILGNICWGNASGIYLYGSSNNTITGNTCQGHVNNGIFLTEDSNYNVVTSNSCNGNTLDGILADSGMVGVVNYNTITGNVCTGNAFGIAVLGGASALKNIVLGNQLLGNGTPLTDGGQNTEIGHNITV